MHERLAKRLGNETIEFREKFNFSVSDALVKSNSFFNSEIEDLDFTEAFETEKLESKQRFETIELRHAVICDQDFNSWYLRTRLNRIFELDLRGDFNAKSACDEAVKCKFCLFIFFLNLNCY